MPIQGLNFPGFTARDLDATADPTLGSLNFYMHLVFETLNRLSGARGTIELSANINMGGNQIKNLGAATEATDALSQNAADPLYSTSVQQAAMEAVGSKMLQTTRRLNDGTQQHTISSDLNVQGSIPPTNITGTLHFATTTTSVTFAWTGIVIQNADQSLIGIQNGGLQVTGLLTATYDFFPYYDTKLGLLVFVADPVNATGSPPVAFPSAVNNTAALQAQNGDGRIALTASASAGQVSTGGASGNFSLRTRT